MTPGEVCGDGGGHFWKRNIIETFGKKRRRSQSVKGGTLRGVARACTLRVLDVICERFLMKHAPLEAGRRERESPEVGEAPEGRAQRHRRRQHLRYASHGLDSSPPVRFF